MKGLYSILFLALLVSCFTLPAQTDTLQVKGEEESTSLMIHSPKKAALYSGILPGLGQAYNKKYWKIPIVYAGLGITAYSIWFNNTYFNELQDAYVIRTDGDPSTVDEYANILPLESQILQYAQFYKKNLDISVLIMAGVWLLNVVDAVVDAHLYNFDISDELSMSVLPSAGIPGLTQSAGQWSGGGWQYGLTLKFSIP